MKKKIEVKFKILNPCADSKAIEKNYIGTGFPIKDASFSKLKNISDLTSDRKVKLKKIWTKNILAIGRLSENLWLVNF